MAPRFQLSTLHLAWRLVERLEVHRGELPLDETGKRDMVSRLAAGLHVNELPVRGRLPVEPGLESLLRASRLVREEVRFSAGRELEPAGVLPEVIDCRLRVPEVARRSLRRRSLRPYYPGPVRALGRYLATRPGLVQELTAAATVIEEEPTEVTPVAVVRQARGQDKLDLLAETLEALHLQSVVNDAADRAGGFADEALAVIRVDTGPALRLDEDGLYPDPTLVLGLAGALLRAGVGRVLLGSAGAPFPLTVANTEPARLLAHLGYLDAGLAAVADLDPAAPPPARVMVDGAERDVPIIDLSTEAGQKTWTQATLRVLVASPRVHGADRLALTLHGLIDHAHSRGRPRSARRSAIKAAQAASVHLALLEATTGADGMGGELSCPVSRLLRTLVAGTDPLVVDVVAAQLFGVDPFSCPLIDRGVRKLGLKSYRLDGRVQRARPWWNRRLGPRITTRQAPLRRAAAARPVREPDGPFAVTAGPLGARLASGLLLRPFWAGALRLDRLRARRDARLIHRLLTEHAGRTRLSSSDPAFLELAAELPRRDIAALLGFLRAERETLEAGQGAPRRLAHQVRVGDSLLELRSFTARPLIAAAEIVRGVTFGRWDLQSVIEDLHGWEEIHALPAARKLQANRLNPPRRKSVAR